MLDFNYCDYTECRKISISFMDSNSISNGESLLSIVTMDPIEENVEYDSIITEVG